MSREQREKNQAARERKDDTPRCRCVGGTRIVTRAGLCKMCGCLPRTGRIYVKED